MNRKSSSGETVPNLPHDMAELAKELDSMPLEDLKEEFDILFSDMDEDSFDGELLEVYLDAIERKSPKSRHIDTQASYDLFLKRLKERERANAKPRGSHGALKIGLIAAVIATLLVASMIIAQAAGTDLLGKIARWTAETFGFSSADTTEDNAQLPPQLQGMKEALEKSGISAVHLPTYWPEGYEEVRITSADDPESNMVSGAFGENENYIILSYIQFLPENVTEEYNIDEEEYELYIHDNMRFYLMTNEGGYLAVWYQGPVEGSISGVSSYEELIKILDSIGG